MQSMATNFFKELYRADSKVNPQQLVHLFQPVITEEMNDNLCKEFLNEEIGDALFQMGMLKAPDPDGFPAIFSKKLGNHED
jgi:hypothetical protein